MGPLKAGLPEKIAPEEAPAIARVWTVPQVRVEGVPFCSVQERHPELTFAFADLPPFKVSRHRPSWGRGIKKEFTSAVTGRDVFSASSLEHDAHRFLELDSSNTAFIEQPFKMRYDFEGKRRAYTPDTLVARPGGLECIEVKFEADAATSETKWQAIGLALAGVGIGFCVLTERHLRRAPLLQNVRTVFRARHARPDRQAADKLRVALRYGGSIDAAAAKAEFDLTFRHLCFLTRHGLLAADLEAAPLGLGTTFIWSGRGSGDPWQSRR